MYEAPYGPSTYIRDKEKKKKRYSEVSAPAGAPQNPINSQIVITETLMIRLVGMWSISKPASHR